MYERNAAHVEALVTEQNEWRSHCINLIASENVTSRRVRGIMGSDFAHRYAEGHPGERYYQGTEIIDEIESLLKQHMKSLFRCKNADVRPISGTIANDAVFSRYIRPGDVVMVNSTPAGGHISHGHKATLTGRDYEIAQYGVRRDTERIDLDEVRDLALKRRPKMIVAGGSAYPRVIDFAGFRAIADEVGALFLVDMAHFAGLVAAKLHPDPFPHAHVVTTTTYKSLRGARGGLVLWNDPALSAAINAGIFPGVQGSVMLHAVAGKAACLGEALRPEFAAYNQSVLDGARALAQTLAEGGLRIVTGGTDTGLMLTDLSAQCVTGDVAAKALERAGLAVNKNLIPFDPHPAEAPSGLRLSSNAGAARGFSADDFRQIGLWILRALAEPANERRIDAIRDEMRALCARYPIY